MRIALSHNVGYDGRGSDYPEQLVALGHDVEILPGIDLGRNPTGQPHPDERPWRGGDPEWTTMHGCKIIETTSALIIANTLDIPDGVANNVSPASIQHTGMAIALGRPVLLTEGHPTLPDYDISPESLANNMVEAVRAATTGTLEGDFAQIPALTQAFYEVRGGEQL